MHGGSTELASHCRSAETMWREVGLGFGRLFRAAAGFELRSMPSATLAAFGVRLADLNCGVIDAEDAAPERIFVMADHLRQRHLPGLLLVTDAAGPTASVAAQSAGLVLAGRMPLVSMAAGTIGPESTYFTVRRVTDTAFLVATAASQPLYEDVGFGVTAWCNVWLVDLRQTRD